MNENPFKSYQYILQIIPEIKNDCSLKWTNVHKRNLTNSKVLIR